MPNETVYYDITIVTIEDAKESKTIDIELIDGMTKNTYITTVAAVNAINLRTTLNINFLSVTLTVKIPQI